MNFSRHQKQHFRQVMRNLANLFSAAGKEESHGEVKGILPSSSLHALHSPGLPEPTCSKDRRLDQRAWGVSLRTQASTNPTSTLSPAHNEGPNCNPASKTETS